MAQFKKAMNVPGLPASQKLAELPSKNESRIWLAADILKTMAPPFTSAELSLKVDDSTIVLHL